jgi:flagellar basal-body rod modification protein FlgD
MSDVSSVTTTTSTDAYGNSYTSSVSTDGLTNEDFLTLMLTELSMQDPTEPVDSDSMLQNQLQLSTLETNLSLAESMSALQSSFEYTALSSSANLIGNVVENGEYDDSGNLKQYKVSSVTSQDGDIYLTAYQLDGYYDLYTYDETSNMDNIVSSSSEEDSITITDSNSTSYEFSIYNKTYSELAEEISAIDGLNAVLTQNTNGGYNLIISVKNGDSSLSQNNLDLEYSTSNATSYSDEIETIPYTSVTKIY